MTIEENTEEIDFAEYIIDAPRGVAPAPPDIPLAEAESRINREFDATCSEGAGQRHVWRNPTSTTVRLPFSMPDKKRPHLNGAPVTLVIPPGATTKLHPAAGRAIHTIVGGERIGQGEGLFVVGGMAPLLERISPPQRAQIHPSLLSKPEAHHE